MSRLSVAMIVKDEAHCLEHCLASVRGLADEVVVVDTGSTDRTIDIARAFGATVLSHPWGDDFSSARNASLEACTGDWILVLDADEAIDPADFPVIRACMASEAHLAFHVVIRTYFLHANCMAVDQAVLPNRDPKYKEGSAFPFYSDVRWGCVRLFRRHDGIRFRGRIHEMVNASVADLGGSFGQCEGVIHHFGKTFTERETHKVPYYLRLAREEALAHPGDAGAQFNLAMQASIAEDWPTTLEASRAYLAASPAAPHLIHLLAAMALLELARPEEALPHLEAILHHTPDHVLALHHRGLLATRLNRLDESRHWFKRATEAGPAFPQSFLAWAALEKVEGSPAEAMAILRKGLEGSPQDPNLNTALVQVSLLVDPLDKTAAEAWAALQRCPQGGEGHWHHLVASSLYRQGQAKHAAVIADLGLQLHPGHPGLASLLDRSRGEAP